MTTYLFLTHTRDVKCVERLLYCEWHMYLCEICAPVRERLTCCVLPRTEVLIKVGQVSARAESVCPGELRPARAYMLASRVCLLENMNCIFFSSDQKPWELMGIVSLYIVLHFWLGTVGGKTEEILINHTTQIQNIRAVPFLVQLLIPPLNLSII